MRKIENKTCKIGAENLRILSRLPATPSAAHPEPVADAGLGASGAATTLVGRCARDPHSFKRVNPTSGS